MTGDALGTRWRRVPEVARQWLVVAATFTLVFASLYAFALREGAFAVGSLLWGTVLVLVLIYALLALGLNLEFGYAGLINFGHILFALIGAYAVALVPLHGGPIWLGLLVGMAGAALIAVLLGLPSVRLREDYLAIVTIGAAEIVRRIAENEQWLTNGTLGINRFPRPLLEWSLSTPWWRNLADLFDVRPYQLVMIVFALASVAGAYLVLERLGRSPWGRVLKSIRDDEDVAKALGKNVLAYKLQALAIGSVLAALAGALLVWNFSNVYPSHFPHLTTFYVWIIIVVGGLANHRGSIVGAAILWGIFELARRVDALRGLGLTDLTGPPQAIFIGLVLIFMVLHRPQGLLGRKEELSATR